MNNVNGVSVLVKVGDNIVGGQTSASLSRTADTIDISSKQDDGYRKYVSSWKDWTVDCDAFVVLGDAGQAALETAFNALTVAEQEVDIEIRVGATDNASGYTYTGKAIITDLSEEYGQDDAVTFNVSFQGTGKLTKTVGVIV